jgi:hypothetical protein
MDPLDQLAPAAADLLARAEATLTSAGAPTDHPVWALLRRLRVLPGDAVAAVAALRPEPLAGAGPALRELSAAYAGAATAVARSVSWSGPAADAYAERATALADHLGVDPLRAAHVGADHVGADHRAGTEPLDHGLVERVAATRDFAEAVDAWTVRARRDLARTLALLLGSAQAVTLRTAASGPVPTPEVITAAADVAARVLAMVAGAYDEAQVLRDDWAARLSEADWRPPTPTGGTATASGPPPGSTAGGATSVG